METQAIDTSRTYNPREIARNGWILSQRGTRSYDAVVDLIKSGKLKATDMAYGKKPRYRVSGLEILRYKREVEGTEVL